MREIKFRQLMNDGSFHYWGYFEDTDSRYPIFTGPLGRNDCHNNADSEQYTGLKDRDGVEIYEGDAVDIVELKQNITGEIIYQDGGFGHADSRTRYTPLFRLKDSILKVQGNIHQHPELLEAE